MLSHFYNGLKRWFFGYTSVFSVRSGSATFNGSSYASVYQERTQYPLRIVGIQFQCELSSQGEYRISVNGNKVFPFNDFNPMDSEFHNLMPINVAAGELLDIEVRSRNQGYKGIVIVQELDVVEMR